MLFLGNTIGISGFWVIGSIFLTQMPLFAQADLHADDSVMTLGFITRYVVVGLAVTGVFQRFS